MERIKYLHPAKSLSISERQTIALQAIRHDQQITELAAEKQVSRDFIYAQKNKALQAIDNKFQSANDSDVLFYLPITKKWISSFIICLILHCRACHRGIYKLFLDAFDFDISLGAIHNIAEEAAVTAKNINTNEDLKAITLAAHDELFHHDKPILSGVDIPTLYCHLLKKESRRDGETWAINLLDLKKQQFKPTRVIADDGSGLRAGHSLACWNIPCDIDNFHITRDLIEMRRYFRNKLKTAITWRHTCEVKSQTSINPETIQKYTDALLKAIEEEKLMLHLTKNIDILVSWMEHDVLNKPGENIVVRRQLFDFIVSELEALARLHQHRIMPMCVKLEDARDLLLAFVNVLEEKFSAIAKQFNCSIEVVWETCKLQRCKYLGTNYLVRSESIVLQGSVTSFL